MGEEAFGYHTQDKKAHQFTPGQLMRTGNYFHPYPFGAHATKVIVADTMYAVPLVVTRNITVDRHGVQVWVGAAGKKARLGIYNDGTNLYPGTLVLDCGEVSVNAGGLAEATIAQALTRGLYWLALVSDGTPTLLYAPNVYGTLGLAAANLNSMINGWSVAQAYGALPDPFTAGGAQGVDTPFSALKVLTLD